MPSLPIILTEPYSSMRSPHSFKNCWQNLLWYWCHKTFVVACAATANKQGVTAYEGQHFSTYTKGLKELLQWLLTRNCKDACMEFMGKYWISVHNVLEKHCSIVFAHPKYVKAICGKKTDNKDAKWIADLFKHNLVADSFMSLADIRLLRDLIRYRYKLTCFSSGKRNHLISRTVSQYPTSS